MRRSSWFPRVVHQAPSAFGTVFVVDEGDERSLRFDRPDGSRQSAVSKSRPRALPLSYMRVAAAALAFTEGRARALVVGLGGGSLPLLLRRCMPRMTVDVVEVNRVVVGVARRFFGVREDSRLHVHVADGADFVARGGPSYDFVLLDAFSDEGIPAHLKAPAFFEDVLHRLAPGGVVVLNIAFDTPAAKERLLHTFARVVPHCARLLGGAESANIVGVGTREPLPPEPAFRRRVADLARELQLPELSRSVASFTPLAVAR